MRWLTPSAPRVDIAGQLGSFDAAPRGSWTDGTVSIPKGRTAERRRYDALYLEALRKRFGGARVRLTPIQVDPNELRMTNAAVNRERYGMYRRMLRAGDAVPPLVVENIGGRGERVLRILDGNHRTQAALDLGKRRLPALLLTRLSLFDRR